MSLFKCLDHEEIINFENSEDYGILHVSNFTPFGVCKKYYVYRLDKNGTVFQSKPFISDLNAFSLEMERRCISLYFD